MLTETVSSMLEISNPLSNPSVLTPWTPKSLKVWSPKPQLKSTSPFSSTCWLTSSPVSEILIFFTVPTTQNKLYKNISLGTDPEDVILSAFKLFDPEGKGTIKKEYLGEVLTTRADRFNEEELASIMDAAPIDADGNLDYKGTNFLLIY